MLDNNLVQIKYSTLIKAMFSYCCFYTSDNGHNINDLN